MAHETATKGRHAELTAMQSLLVKGYTIMEPTPPDVFDLGITRPGWKRFKRVQVKTARLRNRDGEEWVVVTGTKSNGSRYSVDEIDYFIGVVDGVAYMFKNRGLSEYSVKRSEIDKKWTRLDTSINNLREAM